MEDCIPAACFVFPPFCSQLLNTRTLEEGEERKQLSVKGRSCSYDDTDVCRMAGFGLGLTIGVLELRGGGGGGAHGLYHSCEGSSCLWVDGGDSLAVTSGSFIPSRPALYNDSLLDGAV